MHLETNFSEIAQRLRGRIKVIEETDLLLREVATTLLAVTKQRIFQEGRNSFGGPIGTYAEAYMPTRFKYNWGPDKKVILTLTAQMRGDYTAISAGHLVYGLGFHNGANLIKMRKNEAHFKAPIAALTDEEAELALRIFTRGVNQILNGQR